MLLHGCVDANAAAILANWGLEWFFKEKRAGNKHEIVFLNPVDGCVLE